MRHIPVLLKEVMEILDPKEGERVFDCTVGLGGHATDFLKRIGTSGYLVGMDADEENVHGARESLREFKNVELVRGNFREFFRPPPLCLPSPAFAQPSPGLWPAGKASAGKQGGVHCEYDIIFADLGLSSPHLDDPTRGFAYRIDAPLDMRFDRSKGETAAQMIERVSEKELADILFRYGELKESRRLARAIKKRSILTTGDLKKAVEDVIGWRAPKILPQVFQALRIAVNDELEALNVLVREGPTLLKSGGRLGVISFHSLEDRMVKTRFKELCTAEKDPTTGAEKEPAAFELLTKRPICPSEEEIEQNLRSRSAKFRAMLKYPI